MRITAEQRKQNEARIRAAMDRLLRGDIPPGGRCDVKTLAAAALLTAPPSMAAAPTPTCVKNSRRKSISASRPATPAIPETYRSAASNRRSKRSRNE
jgi:hypothetical protein